LEADEPQGLSSFKDYRGSKKIGVHAANLALYQVKLGISNAGPSEGN
jgi:hypothetical protein